MATDAFLVDTNIFIALFNDRLSQQLPTEVMACSVITEMELLSYPKLSFEDDILIRSYLADLTIHDIDDAVKEETIRLRKTKRLKLPDAIIAATAIVHEFILISNDIAMQTVPGLKCLQIEGNHP